MKNSMTKSAIFITVFLLLEKLFAFFRETVFASYYGTTIESDSYFMANTIPNVLFAVVGVAITTTIIPMYVDKSTNSIEEEKNNFISNIINILMLISLTFSIVGFIFANFITKFFAPDFSEQAYLLTTQMTRIMFPSVIFTSLMSLCTAVLNSKKIFIPSVFGAIIPSISVMIGTIITNGNNIKLVSFFTLLGVVLQALFIVMFTKKHIDYKFILDFKSPDIKKILKLILPVTVAIGVAEINNIIDKMLASGLDSGSISAMNYAQKLNTLFLGVLLTSITTVTYPVFSELVAKKNHKSLINTLNKTCSISMMIFMPISVFIFLYRKEIVSIVFGRGAFNGTSIEITSYVFGILCFMLIFSALREIISKFYFSVGNTKVPMLFSSIGILINIALNLILINYMGVGGLALSTVIASIFNNIMLIWYLKRLNSIYSFKQAFKTLPKIILGCIFMLITIIVFRYYMSFSNDFVNIIISGIVSFMVYGVTLLLLRVSILFDYINMVKNKFRKS